MLANTSIKLLLACLLAKYPVVRPTWALKPGLADRLVVGRNVTFKIQVKNKCEVGYTSFLSLLCPWCLDGLRTGQPGLDSRQGQDVSLLHNVQTGSGAHPGSYPMSIGGSYSGCKTVGAWSWDKTAIINFSSSSISYKIPSNAGYFR
jgi:hypothetical protein